MKSFRPKQDATMPGTVALIEEAVHLLRQTAPGTLMIYYAGAGPWVLGFLFFWGYASWFAPTGPQLAWCALALVGLYAWLKVAQAEFCGRLMAQRLGTPPPAFSPRRLRSLAGVQMRFHAWGLFAVPFAAFLMLPFAWAWTFFQNITVLGGAGEDRERVAPIAWTQAKLWPKQSHFALLLLGTLALYVWVNFAVSFILIPQLANRLLGIENFMSFHGWSWMNTTFLSLVTALTWLAIDPLIKAFHVLLLFYGRAQRTGEDLRIELEAIRPMRIRPGTTLLLVLSIGMLALGRPTRTMAAELATATGAVVETHALDQSIDRVLATRDFQWRLRPLPEIETGEKKGPVGAFLKQGIEWLEDVARAIKQTFVRLEKWLERLFPSKPGSDAKEKTPGGSGMTTLRVLLYGLIAIALILIGVVLYLVWKQGRRPTTAMTTARATTVAKPDLQDENIEAAQLPADSWLALAREQAALGEWRLALRALYLSSLARLGAEGLVTLAKFKTNLDYERELHRRALLRTNLTSWFSGRRREFEAVWYGRALAGEDQARAWMADLEKGSLP